MRYQNMLKKIALLLLTISISVITGCVNSTLYNQTEGNVADATLRAEQARKISNNSGKNPRALEVSPGMYVDRTPINLASRPYWLKNRIVIRVD